MKKPEINQLTKIAPIARGLLAEPTGIDDIPYSTVILNPLANQDVTDAGGQPLRLESVKSNQDSEKIREQLQALTDTYIA